MHLLGVIFSNRAANKCAKEHLQGRGWAIAANAIFFIALMISIISIIIVFEIRGDKEITPSAANAAPFSALAITGQFDEESEIYVAFSGENGFSAEVPAHDFNATRLEVSVPPVYDKSIDDFVAGNVNIQVLQKKNGKIKYSGKAKLSIAAMPESELPTGTATYNFLTYVQGSITDTIQVLLESDSKSGASTAEARKNLEEMRVSFAALKQEVKGMMVTAGNTGMASITGQATAQSSQNEKALRISDQIIISGVGNGANVPYAPSECEVIQTNFEQIYKSGNYQYRAVQAETLLRCAESTRLIARALGIVSYGLSWAGTLGAIPMPAAGIPAAALGYGMSMPAMSLESQIMELECMAYRLKFKDDKEKMKLKTGPCSSKKLKSGIAYPNRSRASGHYGDAN